jgi:excisionase family DNA binding protein
LTCWLMLLKSRLNPIVHSKCLKNGGMRVTVASVMVDFEDMAEKLNQIPEMIAELKRLRDSIGSAASRQEYMGYEEAAGYLKLGITTLQQHVCEKRVPHYKVGSRVLFVRGDLDEWVQLKRVSALSKRLDKQRGGD